MDRSHDGNLPSAGNDSNIGITWCHCSLVSLQKLILMQLGLTWWQFKLTLKRLPLKAEWNAAMQEILLAVSVTSRFQLARM